MSKSITFVGLDVHKNSIAVALADAGRNALEFMKQHSHLQKRIGKLYSA